MKGFKQHQKMSRSGHYCWGGKVMKKAEGGGVKSSKVQKEDEDFVSMQDQNVQKKMGLPVSVYVHGKYDSDLSKKVMQENFNEGLRQDREEHGKKMKEQYGSDEDYSYKYPNEDYDSSLPKGESYKTKATENMKRGGKVKPFWETKNPKKESKKLTPAQKASAKARAKKAGRPYPNLIDNSAASRRGK